MSKSTTLQKEGKNSQAASKMLPQNSLGAHLDACNEHLSLTHAVQEIKEAHVIASISAMPE